MKENEIQYPYMPHGRVFVYVGADNPFMIEARNYARKCSSDRQHSTGAVLVRDRQVIARAANQVPIKNQAVAELHRQGLCIRRLLKIPTGQKYWACFGCAAPKNHSECGLVREAEKTGSDLAGTDIYLWGHWWCCEPCWREMERVNIGQVYLLENSQILFNKNHPDNIIGRLEDSSVDSPPYTF